MVKRLRACVKLSSFSFRASDRARVMPRVNLGERRAGNRPVDGEKKQLNDGLEPGWGFNRGLKTLGHRVIVSQIFP
jgi:hypothetical protein